MGLLDYAAHLWRVSKSTLPPMLDEILPRDKQWDYEVAMMRQNLDYWIDKKTSNEPKPTPRHKTIHWGKQIS